MLVEEPAGQVAHADAEAGPAEFRDEEHSGIGPERQFPRGASARGGAEFAVGDEAAGDDLFDPLRDELAAEPGVTDQFRTRAADAAAMRSSTT
jgi:hypothetical protein